MNRQARRVGPALALSLCALALSLGGCSKEPERTDLTPVMVARKPVAAPPGAAPGAPAAARPVTPTSATAATPVPPAAPAQPGAPAGAAKAPGKDNGAILPGGAVAALPAAAPSDLYSPAGKRNPFLPYLRALREGKMRDLQKVPPLQRADLSEFRYVGILKTRAKTLALLETTDGKGYSVEVGDRIGREGGTVTRVTTAEVAIRESTTDSAGNPVVREVLIKNKNANAGGKR